MGIEDMDMSQEEYQERLQREVQRQLRKKLKNDVEQERKLSRRTFLKYLGLGTGGLAFSSLGSSLFKISKPSDQSKNIDADQANGLDVLVDTTGNRPSAGTSGRIFYSTSGDGVYYDNGSSWIQVSKAAPDVTEITTDVVLNGQSIDVTVYEDTDGDGTAENTETVNLNDGTNTYSLSNIEGGSGNDYWLEWNLSTSSITQTPEVNSGDLSNTSAWDSDSEWSSAQSDTRVEHDSTSGTIKLGEYDPLQDNSFNTSKWTDASANNASVAEQNSRLELKSGSSSDDRPYCRTSSQIISDASNGSSLYIKGDMAKAGSEAQVRLVGWWDGSTSGTYASVYNGIKVQHYSDGLKIVKHEDGSSTSLSNTTGLATDTNYHTYELILKGTFSSFDYEVKFDGTTELSGTGQSFSPGSNCPYAAYSGRETGNETYVQNARIISDSGSLKTGKKTS